MRIAQAEPVTNLDTQDAQAGLGLALVSAHKQQQVAVGSAAGGSHGLKLLGSIEFIDGRLHAAVGIKLDIHESGRSHLGTLDPLGELVQLLAGVFSAAGNGDRSHICGRIEHSEAAALHLGSHFMNLHSETHIRLVGTVLVHGIVPAHAGQRIGDIHADGVLEHLTHHAFESVQHVLLLHETHFAVDLSKLRLTVGAQVLVAEAAHNLEVAVVSRHHEQLLESLGTLGKGVESAGVHAGRNHEVASSLGSGLDKVRGLYLHEALPVEVGAYLLRQTVAKRQGPLQGRTAKVEVAVLGAQVFASVALLLNGERRYGCLVEYIDTVDFDFYFSGGHLGVLALTFEHLADDLYYIFPSERRGRLHQFRGGIGLNHQLGDTVTVAQVDEGHASEFTGFLHPSRQGYFFTFV